MSSVNKQYGLIVPQKGGPSRGPAVARSNVFGDDSDSGSDDGGDWVKKALKRESGKSVQKRATKTQIKQALEEDPTVYQYDEVYEQIEKKKAESKAIKKDVEKKPRYIQALLQTAEKRKREAERRIERQVQREREEEGAVFADKESFVTASYRQKLEEFKKLDEEEKRMERLEALADVSKQKDLTGFYRHLYRQTMGETLPGAEQNKQSKDADLGQVSVEIKVEKSEDDHEFQNEADDDDDNEIGAKISVPKAVVKRDERRKDRHYRKRRSSSTSSSEGSGPETKISKPDEENVDADSDLTGDSSSSSESESSGTGSGSEEGEIIRKKDKKKQLADKIPGGKMERKAEEGSEPSSVRNNEEGDKDIEKAGEREKTEDSKKAKDKKENAEKLQEVAKPKINIWVKRTVGQVFEDTLKRYFDRKAMRSSVRMVGRG